MLATTYLPYDVAPGLVDDDLTDQSLYALLERRYDVHLTHGRRGVEAAVAPTTRWPPTWASSPATPSWSCAAPPYAGERPVEMFVAYHRGDRSRFEVTLNRTRPADAHLEPLMRVTAP